MQIEKDNLVESYVLLFPYCRETKGKPTVNGGPPKVDPEKGAIEDRARELEALLNSIKDTGKSEPTFKTEIISRICVVLKNINFLGYNKLNCSAKRHLQESIYP